MTVWNLHHSKFAIFSSERKEMVFDAGFLLIVRVDLVEFLSEHNIWMKGHWSPCMELKIFSFKM